jgi:hypothetical protein
MPVCKGEPSRPRIKHEARYIPHPKSTVIGTSRIRIDRQPIPLRIAQSSHEQSEWRRSGPPSIELRRRWRVGRLDLARREALEWREEWCESAGLGTSCLYMLVISCFPP